jgi:hypothetical protein
MTDTKIYWKTKHKLPKYFPKNKNLFLKTQKNENYFEVLCCLLHVNSCITKTQGLMIKLNKLMINSHIEPNKLGFH